jgi:hypothetical protein
MKALSKLLLVGAVALMAVAVTAVPSDAKGKKGKKAEPAPCTPGWTCSTPDSKVMACGGDRKWYPALWTPVCLQPFCPPKCG